MWARQRGGRASQLVCIAAALEQTCENKEANKLNPAVQLEKELSSGSAFVIVTRRPSLALKERFESRAFLPGNL